MPHLSGRLARVLGFVLLAASISYSVRSAPLRYPLKFDPSIRVPRADGQSCGLAGNADFYGLGIRLGIYLQWTTSLLANLFLKEAVPASLETNTIFLLAVFIATAYATSRSAVQSAEVLVLLHLCFGFIFSILSVWGHRTRSAGGKPIRFPLLGSLFRLTLTTAICAYSVWFWFRGQNLLRHESCRAYTFVFIRENVQGGLHIFYQIQSSIVVAIYSVLFARELLMVACFLCFTALWSTILAGLSVFFSPPRKRKSRWWNISIALKRWLQITSVFFWSHANGKESSGSMRPTLSYYLAPLADAFIFPAWYLPQFLCLLVFKRAPWVGFPPLFTPAIWGRAEAKTTKRREKWTLLPPKLTFRYFIGLVSIPAVVHIVNLACLVWAVVAIELTLVWNRVSGVYSLTSTGQLIPFVIGVVGLLRLIHGLTVERSDIHVTNIIMALLDENPSDPAKANGEKASPVLPDKIPHREAFPLSGNYEAIFWNRKPARRHSICCRGKANEALQDGTRVRNRRGSISELGHSTDHRCTQENVEDYDSDNLEIYTLHDREKLYIVKDFRRAQNRRRSFSSTTSSRSSSSSASSLDSSSSGASETKPKLVKCLGQCFLGVIIVFSLIFMLLKPLLPIKRAIWASEELWSRIQQQYETKYPKSNQANKNTQERVPKRKETQKHTNSDVDVNSIASIPPTDWGLHRRQRPILTTTERDELKTTFFKRRSSPGLITTACDFTIGYLERNDLPRSVTVVKDFKRMMQENAKVRKKYNAREIKRETQHEEARTNWEGWVKTSQLRTVIREEFEPWLRKRHWDTRKKKKEEPDSRVPKSFTWSPAVS